MTGICKTLSNVSVEKLYADVKTQNFIGWKSKSHNSNSVFWYESYNEYCRTKIRLFYRTPD